MIATRRTRRGPGRPRREDKYGGHVAAAEQRIADALPALVDNMLRLASGFLAVRPGGETVYAVPPDLRANIYLIDRILGRPGQSMTLDVDPPDHRTPEQDRAEILAILEGLGVRRDAARADDAICGRDRDPTACG